MYEIRIPDDVYKQVERAAKANHLSLEAFVVEALQLHSKEDSDNFDHLFTPELLAAIDRSAEEVAEGKTLTIGQVREQRKLQRKEWEEGNRG
jgi:hypothetical protein